MENSLNLNSGLLEDQERCGGEINDSAIHKLSKQSNYEALGTFVEIPSEVDTLPSEIPSCPAQPLIITTSTNSLDPSKQSNSSETITKFPDIEKCIPRWKEIFPWVCWCTEDNALYCLHCRELLRKSFPDQIKKSNVVVISSSDKIFTVAKMLRNHHNSTAHTVALYLYSHITLVSFVSLLINHYRDMKYEKEVMETVKGMFNYSQLTKEGFVKMITEVGRFIERHLVKNLKASKYFSIVADQCRGILVLRWVQDNGKIEEHIFWSYILEWNLTPLQYLKRFEINFSHMTLYIASSLCQQCSRCQNMTVIPASLPPRPPSILSFVGILWNLDFLRPLMSLINTIYKLMKIFPYKFAKKFNSTDIKQLFNYNVKPTSLIKIMENFQMIKEIAVEIYESRSYVEALGLAMVDLKNDEKHKKILYHLQEIIDIVRKVSINAKITNDQIVKLNQALVSLKARCNGANFVTYDMQTTNEELNQQSNDKIREFLLFVEMFIDENQRSIYYNGRERIYAFLNICNLNAILDPSNEINEAKLFLNFSIIYDVLKATNATDKMRAYRCIKSFYNYLLLSNKNVVSCIDIINLFHEDKSLQRRFPDSLDVFMFCATMPFQPCQVARSLFVSFVMEQRIESTIWIKMKDNIKPWLLYMQHELNTIPEKNLLTWWLEMVG